MKSSELKSEYSTNESLKPDDILISVIGFSGSGEVKGAAGVGKSSICNRLVRPDQFSQKPFSTISSVDFSSDIINGTNWIYWDRILETINSKIYAFHIIEQTVFINDQTFLPFDNCTESDYINRATSDKLVGSKRAYISQSHFLNSLECGSSSIIDHSLNIDAFLLVFDVSEVNSRNYQAQDRCVTKILTILQKIKRPVVIALSKTDIKSPKIKSRFDSIIDKNGFKSIPVIETSAKLNINISSIPSVVISELQCHSRPLTLKLIKRPYKIPTFDDELSTKKKLKEECLNRFRYFVNTEVAKIYDLSWQDFSSHNDLSQFLSYINKMELSTEFESTKSSVIKNINESLMVSYLVLFKKSLFEFILPIFNQEQGDPKNVQQKLLQNSQFLERFQKEDVDKKIMFCSAYLTNQINYPLPKFLITANHPSNKLHLIDFCVEEMKLQKIERNFTSNFLMSLKSDPELYEDMSFSEIEKIFKDLELWNYFKELAKSIFSDFVSNSINQFKILFDEKLLELSFIIFTYVPVKTCMKKLNIKEKDYKDNIPDMDMINEINNKICFDHPRFNKKLFQKQRINWVVKYIGSLISSNSCQCYHFDFNALQCHANLLRYLEPSKNFIQDIAIVISLDIAIDKLWRDIIEEKMVMMNSLFSSGIQFISSEELTKEFFLNHQFSGCQKINILIYENQSAAEEITEKILNKYSEYPGQFSIIYMECVSNTSEFSQPNIVVKRIKENLTSSEGCYDINQDLSHVIKNQIISYLFLTEPICVWIVVLCDDSYDCSIPLQFLLSFFEDCLVLQRQFDQSNTSMSVLYIPFGGKFPQRLDFTVLSYHQVFKLLNDEFQSFTLHLLMYFCDLNRIASINTLCAVMKNVLTILDVRSVLCPIQSSLLRDSDAFVSRKKMVKKMAFDSGAHCIIIENQNWSEQWYIPDIDESNRFHSIITECENLVNCSHENKNHCKYNNAYENEDPTTSSKIGDDSWNAHSFRGTTEGDISNSSILQHSSFSSRERTFSQSDSLISPDFIFSDSFFQDQSKASLPFINIDYCDSIALGCFNEDLFLPIQEENSFSDEVQDYSTIVRINCSNFQHIELEDQINIPSNCQRNSKIRSFSGPVQVNKSFSRKYSSAQNPFNRSQRYLTKKTQSLTTSPIASCVKSYSQTQIFSCHCKESNDYCLDCSSTSTTVQNHTVTSKSLKNVFSRLFMSDRCSNKSAEEKRSIFRRSLKSMKKNSDKKIKTIPTSPASSEGLFQHGVHSSSSFVFTPPHSTGLSVLDTRTRTKSVTKTIFSL